MQYRSKLRIEVFLLEPHPPTEWYLRDLLKREASFTVLSCGDTSPSPQMVFPSSPLAKNSSNSNSSGPPAALRDGETGHAYVPGDRPYVV